MIPKGNDVISQDEQLEKGKRSMGVLTASIKGCVLLLNLSQEIHCNVQI